MFDLYLQKLEVRRAPEYRLAAAAGFVPEHLYGVETAKRRFHHFLAQLLEAVGLDASAIGDPVGNRCPPVLQIVHDGKLVQQFVHHGRLHRQVPEVAVDGVFYLVGRAVELDGNVAFFPVAGAFVTVVNRLQQGSLHHKPAGLDYMHFFE